LYLLNDPIINKLENYINQYLNLWDFFGVIRVIKKGQVLFEKSDGYACLEFGIKNHMQSRFSLASMSKQFTAFAIMILYERKLLDLDGSANHYLPSGIRLPDKITIHNLLSHTSGLYNFYNFDDDFFGDDNRKNYSREEFFEEYISKKPISEPDVRFDYNNSNYNLLAWIIENVSGMKYGEFVKKNIFEPLNMHSSEVDDGSRIVLNKSFNYAMDYASYIRCPFYNEKFSVGAGAIISNCDDLYQWYQFLRDRRSLSKQTYQRFFSENMNHYCYGLEHANIYGVDRYSHGGDHLGVSTYIQYFFEDDICIIVLANNESINQYRLGNAVADILYDVEVSSPSKFDEITLGKEQLEKYCGTYLKNKIQIEMIDDKLYFTRFKGNLHIELYPVGNDKFARRYCDQLKPYSISFNEDQQPVFFGYSKKNNMIGKTVTVTVDRAMGTYHPEHPDLYYPINYGYIKGIIAPDGEEKDAYILGVSKPVEEFTGKIIAIIHRNNDIEEKWVVAPADRLSFTKEEIKEKVNFEEQYFDSEIIM
jgi:CubicO group peptidase (beta-lactamase class C family)